jgi:uncharacterized membrane protein
MGMTDVIPQPAAAQTIAAPIGRRVASVDLLRGLVMVIMALDHTRDFVHAQAMVSRPEDLTQTTAAIFLTRWITHFCAPVFMFCAGLGACFWVERRGRSTSALSRFLWTRGVWLIVLEFTVVRFGFFFDVEYSLVILLVFWALGMSMIALAALVHLPFRVLVADSCCCGSGLDSPPRSSCCARRTSTGTRIHGARKQHRSSRSCRSSIRRSTLPHCCSC